jgi:hypothetical protein
MSLIENERAKLLATYFNGLAIAVMAIGGFAPLVAFPFSADGRPFWATMLIVIILHRSLDGPTFAGEGYWPDSKNEQP